MKNTNGKEEQEKLKKSMFKLKIFLIVGLILFIVYAVCMFTVDFGTIFIPLGAIGLILIIYCSIKLKGLKNAKIKNTNTTCSQCGNKFIFPQDVKYETLGTRGVSHSTFSGIWLETKTNVRFTCTCSNCKNVQTFNKEFTTENKTTNDKNVVIDFETFRLEDRISYMFNN